MKAFLHFLKFTALLLAFLLAACNTPADSISGDSSVLSSPPNSDASSESPAGSTLGQIAASFNERPPEEMFIPAAPSGLAPYVSPETKAVPMQPEQSAKTIPTFDGTQFNVLNLPRRNSVQSALYSSGEVFFVLYDTLYYCDSSRIYALMKNVYDIAGCDSEGLYLVVEDSSLPKTLTNPFIYKSMQSSLLYFQPKTGTTTTLIPNVQAAIVNKSQDVLFYVTPLPEDNQYGYRYQVKRRALPQGTDTLVFTDDYVASETIAGSTSRLPEEQDKKAAFEVDFYLKDDRIGAIFEYPYPSEFAYERHIWFEPSGQMVGDSEQEELLFQSYFLTTGIYKYSYDYYPSETPVQIGPYQARIIPKSSGFTSSNYLVMHKGKELFWKWDYYGQGSILQSGDLLYCADSVYNGEYTFELPFSGKPIEINHQVYYFIITGYDNNNQMLLYKATGSKADPLAFQILGGMETSTIQDFGRTGMSPSVYTTGNFIIITGENNTLVANTATGAVATAGTQEVTCLLPA